MLAALDPSTGVAHAQGAVGLQQQVSVGAVFDGHAGYATAAYAAQHIPHLLHAALSGTPNRAEGEMQKMECSCEELPICCSCCLQGLNGACCCNHLTWSAVIQSEAPLEHSPGVSRLPLSLPLLHIVHAILSMASSAGHVTMAA